MGKEVRQESGPKRVKSIHGCSGQVGVAQGFVGMGQRVVDGLADANAC